MPADDLNVNAQEDAQELVRRFLASKNASVPSMGAPAGQFDPEIVQEIAAKLVIALEKAEPPVAKPSSKRKPAADDQQKDNEKQEPVEPEPAPVRTSNLAVKTGYRLGIDVGSKTVKFVLLDEQGKTIYTHYTRHRSNVRETLTDVLHSFIWIYPDLEGHVAVTGSAGIAVAEMLGLPFVQEVVATTKAVQTDYPDADCVIELGGEDAKIIYLTGGLEQRMNATCAGGTGGFIDNIAHMLGVRSREMSSLAMGAGRTYPIASRCAVFAQTDVRPLLNAGAKKSDIAASAIEAVVNQTLGGLACGRPIRGKVIFLGGPMEYNSALVMKFRRTLGIDHRMGIKPDDAHMMTAKGVAIMARELEGAAPMMLADLEQRIHDAPEPTDDLDRLDPLFASQEELEEFQARHEQSIMPRKLAMKAKGPFYLGLDAGSTAVKYALVDADGALVRSDYALIDGDVFKKASKMIRDLQRDLEYSRPYANKDWYIARALVTGYGEDLLRAGLGFDGGVVETTAHVRAAREFCPEVSFVLDIGGQDMKALWVRDGHVVDAVLNEACSSGCGAFVEGIARSLRIDRQAFAREALEAKHPVDLGTKCTVFMNSRVRHAQKIGASRADISAGIAYSVVKNALYRIIGRNKAADLGSAVVVQGGTFKSDAVLRAFELVSGVQAIRPDTAPIMGALGAALVARDQVHAALGEQAARGESVDGPIRSSVLSSTEIDNLSPKQRSMRCPGCSNRCLLSVVDFGTGSSYVSGNRCDRAWDFLDQAEPADYENPRAKKAEPISPEDVQEPMHVLEVQSVASSHKASAPNAVAAVRALLARYGDVRASGERGACVIGLLNGLSMYALMPFWHTLFTELGYSVIVPHDELDSRLKSNAAETIPSESVCQPAKLLHTRYFELVDQGVDVVFMPHFVRNRRCPVTCWYPLTLRSNVNSWEGELERVRFVSPELPGAAVLHPGTSAMGALFACLPELGEFGSDITREEFDAAFEKALAEQDAFKERAARATQHALDWVNEKPGRHGVVISGRPYHIDRALMHGIDDVLTRLGVAVIPSDYVQFEHESEHAAEARQAWWPAKHLLKVGQFIEENPALELVALVSFNCGFDAMSFDVVRREFARMHRPFTELKIDDIVDTAHIRIRLRTLVEGMSLYGASAAADVASEEQAASEAAGSIQATEASSEDAAPAAPDGETPARALDFDFAISDRDLETARARVAADLCFTAAAMAAHAGNMVLDELRGSAQTSTAGREDTADSKQAAASDLVLRIPAVCETCLVDAVGAQASRVCGFTPSIEWTHEVPAEAIEKTQALAEKATQRWTAENHGRIRPKVGIVGNPLLCFDTFMNENVVELLGNLGCEVVLPDPERLFTDDVRYLDQLDVFYDQGVRHVLYLQSFSCLKGHTHARGALRDLAKIHPDLVVTVLDYDPESSALNRENRVRLAAHAAREALKEAD